MNTTKIAGIVSLLILLTGFIDVNFNLLQDAGLSLMTINRIRLFGLALSTLLPGVAPLFPKKEK